MINEGIVRNNVRRIDFDFSEYLDAVTKDHESFRPDQKYATNAITTGWHGVSFDRALELYKDGWPEGLLEVAKLRSQIEGQLQCRYAKMELKYEVFGGVPDVGAFLSGEPENMIHKQGSDKISQSCGERKIVSMVVNIGASSHSDNKTISLVRGSIACAVLDVLESLGFRVEVYAATGLCGASNARFKNQKHNIYIKLKDASQPLDMDKISFPLCHTSMLRRLGLALHEVYGYDNFNAYGRPTEVSDKGDIYIPHEDVMSFGNDLGAWAAKTLELLKSVGVEID